MPTTQDFVPLILLIFMLENFNPLINLFLFVPDSQVLVPQLLSFDNGADLFCSSKFN